MLSGHADLPGHPAPQPRGLRDPLAALRGRRFRIGDVLLEGTDACDPCCAWRPRSDPAATTRCAGWWFARASSRAARCGAATRCSANEGPLHPCRTASRAARRHQGQRAGRSRRTPGWTPRTPGDYTDIDAKREVSPFGDVLARLRRLQQRRAGRCHAGPVVLAGSSLGAWISARVSLVVPLRGLFLMAPPIHGAGMPTLDAAAVPISIIHGWHDALIPARRWSNGPARATRPCCWSTTATARAPCRGQCRASPLLGAL